MKGTLCVRPSANLRTTDDDALVCGHFLCNSFDQSFNPEFARSRHAQAFNFACERHGLIVSKWISSKASAPPMTACIRI